MLMTYRDRRISKEQLKELQHKRLKKLVLHAKENSNYFSSIYKNVGDEFSLKDLPITDKVNLMAVFNDWLTDREVTYDIVNSHMEDKNNIGKLLNGKYLVVTTSGSTGNPAVVLYDKSFISVASAVAAFRSFSRKEDLKAFMKNGKKSAGVYADNGFYLACSMTRYNMLKMPWRKNQKTIDVLKPLKEVVTELNSFKPSMLSGYPTNLELLSDEKESGNLNISPDIIMTGGEYLAIDVREKLSNTFGCTVQTHYSCTETGVIACECKEKHLHINEDWVIVEAVDKMNNPVPFGKRADKLLVTNLANFIQPFIRYEVTDRVILHDTPCPCGNKSIWLEIEGRTDEVLDFGNEIRIAPMSFYVLLKEIHEVKRFQIIQHNKHSLELRIVAENRENAFKQAKMVLSNYLAEKDVNAEIWLSDTEPKVHPKSGKFKHIYKSLE